MKKLRRPSPAMVVSIVALVMATTGSAIAAVNYARNAGAVDGKSAVSAGASLRQARGNLVATARGGSEAGRIPGKFLSDVARAEPMGAALEAPDNAQSAPVEIVSQAALDNVGRLTASCVDRDQTAGRENADVTIAYANTSGLTENLARRVGTGEGTFGFLAPNAVDEFRINGENTFTYQVQQGSADVLIEGVARQEGTGTANGSCIVYGTAMLVR